jgi:hypothetical protein
MVQNVKSENGFRIAEACWKELKTEELNMMIRSIGAFAESN